MSRILSDPYATETLSTIWSNMRKSGVFSQDSLWTFVDSLGYVMDQSQKLNFTRWDNLDRLLTLQQFAPGTYKGELDIIKNYLRERILWIDKKLGYKDYKEVDPTDTLIIIRSAQDLLAFQHAVNDQGLININGRIETDLDLTSLSPMFEPIGTAVHPYIGIFDGQGHTISGFTIRRNSNYVGLFGVVSGGAVIRNLVFDATCSITGNSYVGIIGGSNGPGTVTMECLGNEGSVTALERNAGGIFGCNMSAAATPIFRNCYVVGAVKGARESGQITGYAARGEAYNCYGSGSIDGVYYEDMSDAMLRGNPMSYGCYSIYPDRNVTVIDETQLTSGELCYLLNGRNTQTKPVWFQTLGLDDHPVLNVTHAQVLLASDGNWYNEDQDGIRTIQNLQPSLWGIMDGGVYDLQGRRVNNTSSKGIHIIHTPNGTSFKVAIK